MTAAILYSELVVEQRGRGHQHDDGLIADGNRHRQILAAGLGMSQLNGDVVLWNRLYSDPIWALHHQPIHADVLDIVIVQSSDTETMHALSM